MIDWFMSNWVIITLVLLALYVLMTFAESALKRKQEKGGKTHDRIRGSDKHIR